MARLTHMERILKKVSGGKKLSTHEGRLYNEHLTRETKSYSKYMNDAAWREGKRTGYTSSQGYGDWPAGGNVGGVGTGGSGATNATQTAVAQEQVKASVGNNASYRIGGGIDPGNGGVMSTAGAMGRTMWDNIKHSAGGSGWDATKAIGGQALRGAVVGAGIEGTYEAAQGGSFWTGAKAGAFDGAMVWGGYKAISRGITGSPTGVGIRNTARGAGGMYSDLRSQGVSKQVTAITRVAGAQNVSGQMLNS